MPSETRRDSGTDTAESDGPAEQRLTSSVDINRERLAAHDVSDQPTAAGTSTPRPWHQADTVLRPRLTRRRQVLQR
ncbi:hypothetical protein ACNPQM_04130 [Streptomyces sp. NPDC056231]|uniref:hypothetical protein n=1 Tax=Streptomyces sp. NPDC056231 TaxID=3345755 RepID=UPI003AAA2EAF